MSFDKHKIFILITLFICNAFGYYTVDLSLNEKAPIFNNPAAIVDIDYYQFLFSQFYPFGSIINENVIGVKGYISKNMSFGFLVKNQSSNDNNKVIFSNSFIDDNILKFSKYEFNTIFGIRLPSLPLSLGTNIKIMRTNVKDSYQEYNSGIVYTLDLGLKYNTNKSGQVGLSVNNILPLKERYINDYSYNILKPIVGWKNNINKYNIMADVSTKDAALLCDYQLFNSFNIFTGSKFFFTNGFDDIFFGLKYKIKSIDVQYVFDYNFNLGVNNSIILSYNFNYYDDRVEVEDIKTQKIITPIYPYYNIKKPIGLYINNRSDSIMQGKITLESKILNKKFEKPVILRPNYISYIEPELIFSDKMIYTDENSDDIKYTIEYTDKVKTFSKGGSFEIDLLPREKYVMNDYNHIGAFIQYNSSYIKQFVRNLIQAAGNIRDRYFIENKIQSAIYIYSLIKELNIQTQKMDIENYRPVYPLELIKNRKGTELDISILWVTLLKNIGIDSKIVLLNDNRVLTLLNFGVAPDIIFELGDYTDYFVQLDDGIYLPVIANFDNNIYSSITKGYSALNEIEDYQAMIDINSALEQYPPVQIDKHFADMKIDYNVQQVINNSIEFIKQLELARYNHIIEPFNERLRTDKNNYAVMNRLAIIYANFKNFDQAIKLLNKAVSIKSDYFPAYNNLGNIYIELGDKQKAISYFKKALSYKPDDNRIKRALNLYSK